MPRKYQVDSDLQFGRSFKRNNRPGNCFSFIIAAIELSITNPRNGLQQKYGSIPQALK